MEDELLGCWIDTRNGSKVNVVNNVYDGDRMILVTSVGDIDAEEFSRFFVKADETNKPINEPIEKTTISNFKAEQMADDPSIFSNTNEIVTISETPIIQKESKSNNIQHKVIDKSEKVNVAKEKESNIKSALDKFFAKIDNKPSFNVTMEWENFPKDQINMLCYLFDITIDDIAEYIQRVCLSEITVKNILINLLQQKLS